MRGALLSLLLTLIGRLLLRSDRLKRQNAGRC